MCRFFFVFFLNLPRKPSLIDGTLGKEIEIKERGDVIATQRQDIKTKKVKQDERGQPEREKRMKAVKSVRYGGRESSACFRYRKKSDRAEALWNYS